MYKLARARSSGCAQLHYIIKLLFSVVWPCLILPRTYYTFFLLFFSIRCATILYSIDGHIVAIPITHLMAFLIFRTALNACANDSFGNGVKLDLYNTEGDQDEKKTTTTFPNIIEDIKKPLVVAAKKPHNDTHTQITQQQTHIHYRIGEI